MASTTMTQQTFDSPANLTYLEWHDHYETEKPFMVIRYPDDPPEMNLGSNGNVTFKEGTEEIIHDIRGREKDFTLDGNGFEFAHVPTSLSPADFLDDNTIQKKYLALNEAYLKEKLGADEIVTFHHRVRNTLTSDDHQSDTGPARTAHVDLSSHTVIQRIRDRLPDRADFILRGRIRFINTWRPINGPLQNWPLAVCDGNTLPDENLILTERIRADRHAIARFVVQSPGIKWYYQSAMENDTLLVFKSYDSQEGAAKYAAHCSFPLPTAGPDTPPRESIEVRAMVFNYPKEERLVQVIPPEIITINGTAASTARDKDLLKGEASSEAVTTDTSPWMAAKQSLPEPVALGKLIQGFDEGIASETNTGADTKNGASPVSVIPIQASCGADIIGFDFEHLYPSQVSTVKAAWRDYGVLRFRGYTITPQQHVKFSNLFGNYVPVKSTSIALPDQPEITVISNVKDEAGKAIGSLGNEDLEWHSDSWFFEAPPCGQVLRAIQIPSSGGETYWCNMYAVYDALPEPTRKIIEGRLIQFDTVYDGTGTRLRPGQEKPTSDDFRTWKHVRHPIVRTNPESGKKAVYIGYFNSGRNWIVGLSLERSKAILEEIYALIESRRFIFKQVWQEADVIMWDNRCTMHRRDGWDGAEARVMHRTGTGMQVPQYLI